MRPLFFARGCQPIVKVFSVSERPSICNSWLRKRLFLESFPVICPWLLQKVGHLAAQNIGAVKYHHSYDHFYVIFSFCVCVLQIQQLWQCLVRFCVKECSWGKPMGPWKEWSRNLFLCWVILAFTPLSGNG